MESEVNGILIAAHELKSPLALVRQLAFSLELEPLNREKIERTKNQLITVSERALRQVNDLTKIARLEDGLFEMEPVAVRAVCDDVVYELHHLFRQNQRSLQLQYQNKSRLVVANRDLLFSIIYNFCLNAMHYSGEETESLLSIKERQGQIQVGVRDFGPALPLDVWKELKRGWLEKPTSIAMRPGSSGLGLYIASKFARYMHAEIQAIRHRDGTSFLLNLPISRQASLF
ncbi:MAG: HAMP domain-containing sensor histidine kinase [Candidatus Saccharibacteria bacterium]|nr:HAMP domain-containing sensor histidine kinase [Candidatus Saccharibacteria bacterium]